jgi:Flp pilus assembly CpaE family ATPase
VTMKEMRDVLDLRPSGVIPFQPTLFSSAVSNTRLAATRRGKFADALAALVLELSGRPRERRRWWRAAK